MMHCMLLSYNIWHSACCDICRYDIVTVCCCDIPSLVIWHVFRTFENIMFQSFIILSFLSYFEFSLNVLYWVIVELYSVKQKTESVQFVDVIAPQCHVTLPNMKLNIWKLWHWTFGINFTTRVWRFVCLMVFNTTFNNISVISSRSVLLVEETAGPQENQQLVASHRQTLSHNVVHLSLIEIRIN